MDLNLLPENLREEEAKLMRKKHKSSDAWKTELHVPESETDHKRHPSDTLSGAGFWSKLLGKVPQKSLVVKSDKITLTAPKTDKPTEKGFNLLDSPIESLLDPIDEKSGGWFKGIFGQPVSPIVAVAPKAKINPIQSVSKTKNVPVNKKNITTKIDNNTKSKSGVRQPAGDSWGAILGGLFSRSGKVEDKLNFAKPDNNSDVKIKDTNHKFTEPVKPKIMEQHFETPITSVKAEDKKVTKPIPKAEVAKQQKKITKIKNELPAKDRSVEFGINLMPHDLQRANRLIKSSAILYFSLMLVISLVLLSGGYVAVIILNNSVKDELVQNNAQLAIITHDLGDFSSRATENNLFASKVKAIVALNQQKKTWIKFLPLLEKYTLDGVYYGSLAGDTSGVLVLPGTADNYDILAKQLVVLRDAKEFVKEAKISGAQASVSGRAGVVGVSFQLRLILQDEVFKSTK